MKKKVLLALFLHCAGLMAAEKELDTILELATSRSLANRAALETAQASDIESKRAGKHWLPKVYLAGQSYLSNDPANALFGKLLERKIENTDFRSDLLNHPGTELYNKVTVGLDMPLYEGGQKEAIQRGTQFLSRAKAQESADVRREFRNEMVRSYFEGSALETQKNELGEISSIIDSTMKKYEIGRRENQLGHSGLLGLKGLKSKIEGLLAENSARMSGVKGALSELSGRELDLKFAPKENFFSLIDEYLPYSKDTFVPSAKTGSFFESANGATEMIKAEKSRDLPRIGLFGEGSAFKADRGMGKGLTAGLYLNWNLHSYNDYGASTEAVHRASSAQYYAEALLQKEKIEYNGSKEMLSSLKKALSLLDQSEEQLSEQTKIARDLFKNGLINALQYVEVLNRRVDLIQSKNQARIQLVSVQAQLAKFQSNESQSGEAL